MATIGNFTADKEGFNGTLRTLTLNVKAKLVSTTADVREPTWGPFGR